LSSSLGGVAAVLDGEIVAVDRAGRPSFGLLQQRMHVQDPHQADRWSVDLPVTYQIFDLLHLDGHDLVDLPYRDRRRLLEDLVGPGPAWDVPRPQSDGPDLLEAVTAAGLEGLVAKQWSSRYAVGKRSRSWTKVKVRARQEFVVGGWTRGEGSRRDRLGALLVGYHDDGVLRFAGKVGTGFDDDELRQLAPLLRSSARETSPFEPAPPPAVARQALYVEPTLVVEVAFAEWTGEGRLLHPSYLGRRFDKQASEVGREN
jgi:bifunctional non-homologous end joining protein LigD